MRKTFLLALTASILVPAAVPAATVLSEGFNDISTLSAAGWAQVNNSTSGGTTSWFQGDPTSAFNAQAGAANSYIAANFNAAVYGGNISDWLILPTLTLQNGDTLTFWTRTEASANPGDNLEVRLSTSGTSTNVGATTSSVGDFNTLLTTVGANGYPESWTQYTVTLSGLSGPTALRLAFRYDVTDTSANGDIIGIDSVTVNSAAAATPEPSSLLLLGAGAGLLALKRARRI